MTERRKLVSIADVTNMIGEDFKKVTDPVERDIIRRFFQRYCDFSKLPDWTPRPSTDLAPDIKKQMGKGREVEGAQ